MLPWHDDGGAEPVVPAEPVADQPVIHRAAQRCGQIRIVDRLRAVEAIADGNIGAERIQRPRLHQFERGCASPVRPDRGRTATNLLIDRFGIDAINVDTTSIGLKNTHLYKKVF